MKADQPKPVSDSLFYKWVFALGTLLLIGYLIYLILNPFLTALAWAFIFAFLLYPLYTRLVKLMKNRARLAAFVLTFLTLLLLLGPLSLLTTTFTIQATDLLKAAKNLNFVTEGSVSDQFMVALINSPTTAWLQNSLNVSPSDIQNWINKGASNALGFVVSAGGNFVLGALSTVTTFSITIFILFFFLRDGKALLTLCKDIIPMSDRRKEHLIEHLSDVMRAVIFGTVFTAIIQGVLTGVALAVLGIPAAVVLGVIAALLALLPVGGTALVWAPVCVILAMNDRWIAAIGLALWGTLLVGTIDNVLRPLLVSSQARIGTLTVFLGVIGGALTFGLAGLLLGPVILALAIALIRFSLERRFTEDEPVDV